MIETCSKTFINRTELKGTHIILYVIFSFKYFLIFGIKLVKFMKHHLRHKRYNYWTKE